MWFSYIGNIPVRCEMILYFSIKNFWKLENFENVLRTLRIYENMFTTKTLLQLPIFVGVTKKVIDYTVTPHMKSYPVVQQEATIVW